MIESRRMEVYSAIFEPNYERKRAGLAEIITENSFEDLEGTLYFIGDCSEKCKSVLNKENYYKVEYMV